MANVYSTIAVATDTGTEVQSKIANGASGTLFASGGTGSVPAFTATPSVTSITLGGGTALANYLQGTFTPAIAFGGSSTGVTYSSQTGEYTRIGNVIYYSVAIILSSKGAQTGNATITGFPVTVGGNPSMTAINYFSGITLTALYTNIAGYLAATTVMSLFQSASTQNAAAITDVMFSNGSQLYFSGMYFIS